MTGVRVQWSTIHPGVAKVDLGSGLVTSAGNGTTTLSARTGGAVGQASLAVEQVPAGIEAARGDGQGGFVDEPLPVSAGGAGGGRQRAPRQGHRGGVRGDFGRGFDLGRVPT